MVKRETCRYTLRCSKEIQLKEMSGFGAIGLAFTRNKSFDEDWSELSVDALVLICTKV